MDFWTAVQGVELQQGDWLPRCIVPFFPANLAEEPSNAIVQTKEGDLIVLTQSCDLVQGKLPSVTLCPIWSVAEFESLQPRKLSRGEIRSFWNNVRKGRVPSLHLLASPSEPANPFASLVVDFRETYSLPLTYLMGHASSLSNRFRLQSPYLEHFSQAFARFYMRVGLPSSVPEF